MKSYQVGKWKTKSGFNVVIFEVSERIFGKLRDEDCRWRAWSWDLYGAYGGVDDAFDLAPLEPERVEFETNITPMYDAAGELRGMINSLKLHPLIGRKVRVIVEAIE